MSARRRATREAAEGSFEPSPTRRLFDAALVVLTTDSEDEAVRRALSAARKVVPFDLGGVYWGSENDPVLRAAVSVGTERLSPDLAAWNIPLDGSIAGEVVRTGQAELVNEAHLDPRSVYPVGAEPAREHLICAPLKLGGRVEGVVLIGRAGEEPFSDQEFELLQLFAGYLSVALQNARSLERVREAGKLNTSLVRIGQRLAAAGQASEVLQSVLDEAVLLLHGEVGIITTWDAAGERLIIAARHSERGQAPGDTVPLEHGASGRAARTKMPVIINDYQQTFGSATAAGQIGITAMLVVPLLHEDRLLGTLGVGSLQQGAGFSNHEAQALELLAETASAALVGVERSQIEGVQLAIRSAQHEVNNQLSLAIGYAEMLTVSERLPQDLRDMASEALRGAQGAANALEKLRKVTQVALVEMDAPGGPVIDLRDR